MVKEMGMQETKYWACKLDCPVKKQVKYIKSNFRFKYLSDVNVNSYWTGTSDYITMNKKTN